MFKKMVMVLVLLALALGLSGLELAEERTEFKELKLTSVREEPVNLLSYTTSGLDFATEVVKRLVESGKPAVVFGKSPKAALEVTFVEGMLGANLDLVGGMTLKNEEPSNFVWGLKYTGLRAKSGGIWDIFSKLEPTLYNERGEWFIGVAYAWRD